MIPKQSKRLGKRMGLGHGMATLWHSGSDNGWNQGWRVFSFHKKRERAKEPPKNPRKITGYIVGVGVRCRWTCLDLDCFGTFFLAFFGMWQMNVFGMDIQPVFFLGVARNIHLVQIVWITSKSSTNGLVSTWVLRFFFSLCRNDVITFLDVFFWKRNHYTKNHH